MALSKNRIKYIRSLELKKNRKADKVFLAEGPKLVGDLLGHFRCRFLIATAEWLSAHRQLPVEDITEVSEKELSCASLLKTPQQVLAVFEQPDEVMDASVVAHSLCLALDDVQDPGNLGTMFRTAEGAGMSGGGHSKGETALYFSARADWLFERHTGIRHFPGRRKYVHATTLCPWTYSYGE